jgi:tetratricopeptide (TPR) repeat protein
MSRTGLALILACVLSAPRVHARAQAGQAAPDSGAGWTYYPPSPEKSVDIGNFYLRRDDPAGALSRFREALHNDPDYAPAYLGLGRVYEKMHDPEKALAAYEKYLQELPSDRAAARARGVHRAISRLKRELAQAKGKRNQGGSKTAPSRQAVTRR